MSGVTPNGIRYPDGASKAKNLGPELQQMAEDIDEFIDEHFDPNAPLFKSTAEQAVDAAVPPAIDAAITLRELITSADTHRLILAPTKSVPMNDGETLFVLNEKVAIDDCESAVASTKPFWDSGAWSNSLMPDGRPVLRLAAASGVQGRGFVMSADDPDVDLEMLVLQRTFGRPSYQCGINLRGRVAQTGYNIGVGGGSGNPRLTLYKRVDGVTTFAAGIAWDFPFGSTYEEHALWIRARIDGGRIRAKGWAVTEDEPAGWMLDWTDDAPLAAGWNGVFNADTTTADWARVSWNANGGEAP